MVEKAKAVILGWLATMTVWLALGCLIGAAWFVISLVRYDDHRPDDGSSNLFTVLAVMSLVLALRFSFRFGRLVGRDWYRSGQGSTR